MDGLERTKKMKRMERRSHAHAMDESPVWRISHGQATCQRRTLATHRTALASTQASSLPVPRRKPLDYRKVLTGIIFVLKTGIPWEQLPQEMGCGCGMTCLNYLNAWQRAGVWEKLHQILLAELEQADKLDWSCAAVDSAKARALGGGDQTGPNPTDRGKPGTKHHVLTERSRRAAGDPQHRRPTCPTSTSCCRWSTTSRRCAARRTAPAESRTTCTPTGPDELSSRIARSWRPGDRSPPARRRRTEHGSGLGVYRWVAEPGRLVVAAAAFARLRCADRSRGSGPMMPSVHRLQLSYVCGSYDKVFF